jgi:DNA-binding GntR family transcriptional regulator
MPVPETTRRIQRPTVRQIAFEKLRDWIEDGTLAAGETVKDVDIAERLGVSRTPVREALQMLEQLGAIEAVAGRHTRVSTVSQEDADLVVAPLALLHGLASELATPNVTAADLAAMDAANSRLAAAVEAGDPVGAKQADDAFHQVLLKRASNPYLLTALEPLQHQRRRLDSLYFAHTGTSEASIEAHRQIAEAIEAGDASRARELTVKHWQDVPVGPGRPPQ